MTKRIVCFLLVLLSFEGVFAEYTPSESAQISVLVCSPGEPIYSQFGHAAIRVCDTAKDVDVVFDYGVFEIDDVLSFAWNFLTGEMYYLLDARPYHFTKTIYEYEQRGIVEYTLNLTQQEKEQLCKYLLWNLKPQNKSYLYNFFDDNCATRIRDIIENVCGDVEWSMEEQETWRQTLLRYMGESSWEAWGSNLGLGLPADKMMTVRNMMFVPDYLGKCIENGIVTKEDAATGKLETKNVTASTRILLEGRLSPKLSWWNNASVMLWLAFVLILIVTVFEIKRKKRFVLCDSLIFFVLGLLGCFVWITSFFSVHSLVFPNCNVLWLTPLHVIFALVFIIPSWRNITKWYIPFSVAMVVVYVLISGLIGQFIPSPSWAVMAILVLRMISFPYNFSFRENTN
ncbi:MAG: DUF4105 domain-containing protein [Bacteroidales bacterium]|nr:DUF4105 domain-containing protein [Bacteroidales bacterium]